MSLVQDTIGEIIADHDYDSGVTREDWEQAVARYFDNKEEEKSRYEAWDDDAHYYSAEGTDYVFVTVVSRNGTGEEIHYTDFRLTPDEARSMFLGIRDRYNGGLV